MLEGKILIPSQGAERAVLGKINLESGSLFSERRKIYAQVCACTCERVWVFLELVHLVVFALAPVPVIVKAWTKHI